MDSPQNLNHKGAAFQYSAAIALIITIVAIGFYIRGTAPSVATIFDDSLEFPLVVHRLGIAHPTGYPLYTLLGKLFSLFNPNNVAYQVNMMSAVFGGLVVVGVYLTVLALHAKCEASAPSLPMAHAGAIIGAILFATGAIYYSQATIAEVYTLNAFFVAAILLATLHRRWLTLVFLFGLALTHHFTIVLLVPAVLGYCWLENLSQRGQDAKFSFVSWPLDGFASLYKPILAFILPLLLYLYLPIRGHIGSLDGTYEHTLRGFLRHISGGGYGTTFLFGNPFGHERDLRFYWTLISSEVGWWGVGLAVFGLILLIKRNQSAAILTGSAFIVYLIFNLFYSVSDIAVFFIPIFLILAIWAGFTTSHILGWLWHKQAGVATVIAISAIVLLVWGRGGESRANDWAVHDLGRDIVSQALPENSVIVGILGEMTLVRYFQEVQGLRPDIETIAADLNSDRLAQIERLLSTNPARAVYLTRELPGAQARWSLSAKGPLIRVNARPLTQKPPPNPDIAIQQDVDLPIIAEISLTRYAISRPETHQARNPVRLAILWRVNGAMVADYKISARLLDGQGNVATAVDAVPVHFAYPTSAWRPHEFVSDVYDIQLPPDFALGEYTPVLILYDPAQNAAELGRVTLPATYIP